MKPALVILALIACWAEAAEPTADLSSATQFPAVTARVAVLDFQDASDGAVTPQEVLYLSNLVRGAARRTLPAERFVLMTRENIQELLPEGRTLADCVGECAVETGRRIGADYVATGEVTVFAGEIRVTVNMHDTATKNLLGQVIAGAPKLLGVEKDLNGKILTLLAPLRGNVALAVPVGGEERPIGGGTQAWSAGGATEEVALFESDPAGALVEIDGQPVGETPCKRALRVGVYQIGFKKVRYLAHTQALEVKSGAVPKVSATLMPDFGWLTVESDPPGLPLTIDGESAGRTPLAAREIDTGPHDVLVSSESYNAEGRHVVIDRGEREFVRVAPVPRNGGIKVIATDAAGNAATGRVLVDGREVGKAYQPVTLIIGKHRVEVTGEEGAWAGDVVVEEAKLSEVSVKLLGPAQFTRIAGGSGLKMVAIPPGSFLMGSPPEEPGRYDDEVQHEVQLTKGFMLSATEVTQAQYEHVMGRNPSELKGADRPVERVTWYDAVIFCNKLSTLDGLAPAYRISGSDVTWDRASTGYRLPTEAEWEYACRAGTMTVFAGGNDEKVLGSMAWFAANVGGVTHAVGAKEPNAWGLFDMHGNVWEWCWDLVGRYGSTDAVDPQGVSSGAIRVNRGGSWASNARGCRSACRSSYDASYANYALGFRVARNAAH